MSYYIVVKSIVIVEGYFERFILGLLFQQRPVLLKNIPMFVFVTNKGCQ